MGKPQCLKWKVFDRIQIELDITGEKNSEHEDIAMEVIQKETEAKKKKSIRVPVSCGMTSSSLNM